ncbi:uncharacterized protein B0T15DRAFT_400971 [Chaetomium strumarium]|uniref:Uncharacterized protein n=1 Tax=Chaetomium strumarium TaxID=1170767 RepID=A0AAJ0GMU8_9PEZI|nr:hypothetical protein B0T15DRAFT_400971 [Chaetomium strumarium]
MSLPWSEALASFGTSAIDSRSSECKLSPAASAFSAMLSAFIGSVVNGLTNGWVVAFMTGWIAWLAIFRVLIGGLYMFYHGITDTWGPGRSSDFVDPPIPATAYDSHHRDESRIADENVYTGGWQAIPEPEREGQPSKLPLGMDLDRKVTALGWVSLVYTAVFAPITQILFVAANASRNDNGSAKLVKGLTVAVTALPLCIDCRVRYADSLKWGRYAFNVFLSLSCLLQGGISAALLITGVVDLSRGGDGGLPLPAVVVVYLAFSFLWMAASVALLPMRDGKRKGAGTTHWVMYILDVGMGAFAGVFLAAPAFALYQGATFANDSSGMSDLVTYLSCERQGWRRFAAVAP